MANDLQTAFNSEKWSKRVLTRLDRLNVMLGCGAVNRDYEGEIKAEGDTVWVRTFGNVTMQPYARGGSINYEGLTPAKEALTINDSAYFAFQVDDLDEAQNDIRALDGYAQRAAVAMDELIDTKTLSYYANAPTANKVTNSGSAITISASNAYTSIVAAGLALDLQSAPKVGRWCIVGPTYKSFLLQDTTYFIRATDMGDRIIQMGSLSFQASSQPGYLGECAGFHLFLSNAIPGDATGYYNQFGSPGVISYAGKIRKVETIRLQNTFATAARGLILHDGTVFAEHKKAFGYILTSAK